MVTITFDCNDAVAKCFIWMILFNSYSPTVLRGLHRLCDIIFIISLRNKFYYPHFTGKDTKTSVQKTYKQKSQDIKNAPSESRAFLRHILIIFIWNNGLLEKSGMVKKVFRNSEEKKQLWNVLPCLVQMVKFNKCTDGEI